ncbi:hydrogenase nickel incorporation protein HypB [Hydrogenophaga sp.]|jgi:hydrogenase nickel incorporation protein HypB|uniref:hydrogenase nickel incorporation protein HypB n=1 Tax=Hydrogenophaga sp. TaxID=1904254 RepID=UPI0015F458FB|nr:hydrogenase nickel incorporation protein HypB [Hydrogenophaga sp.]MBI2746297.1 hydrogenase nickel incorporation protein HypB [Burkholderiales bacterium]MDO9253246.1 hydrogenase nickel incorporation protein HypB [Hydrogenophaga sp.]MDP2017257.1 hydrogenase nickel incorporation protein HypB [Hydrogenophaga sp.]MDP3627924.1 hydrogenase nickel incorporation protein HypB [Hydrogenophaga sp.]MDZ4103267.1 hydrogenase nickel incorporation protein HypB [Hydrogenophaga sp.]
MCVVCGCSNNSPAHARHVQTQAGDASVVQVNPANGDLHFGTGAARVSVPGMSQARAIKLETDILGANNRVAVQNRAHFEAHGVTALNLVSSPGSGKTTLLCATIEALKARSPDLHLAVIEGDQQTSFDADRIRATGAPAIQVNTGKGCHLDAPMVSQAFAQLHSHDHHGHDPAKEHSHDHNHHDEHSLLFIENVGNLVCPAVWDLGEAAKVAILSVTEGEDKPLKYPDMFAASSLMVLNKIDLLAHVKFDVARCIELARRVNPTIEVIQLSATTGEGMDAWLHWLDHAMGAQHHHHDEPASEEAVLRERVQRLEAELARAKAALPADAAA